MGASAKIYFRLQKGWDLAFTSLAWKDKTLVFSDLSLKDHRTFSLRAPSVFVSIQNKHLEIHEPDIFVRETIPLDASSSWTIGVAKGTLHIRDASISLEVKQGLEGQIVEIACEQFPLSYLHPWTGFEWEGEIRGSLRFASQGDLWTLLEGSIEGSEMGCYGIMQGVSGKIDWNSPLEQRKETLAAPSSKGIHWGFMMEQGRLRLQIDKGNIFGLRQQEIASHLQGSLSYDGMAGAKWAVAFDHLGKKMEAAGRGFFHGLQGHWIESELCSDEASIFVECREKKEGYVWDVKAESLHADMMGWLQDLSSLFGYSSLEGSIQEGIVNGFMQFYLDKTGHFHLNTLDGSLENIRWSRDCSWAVCKEARIQNRGYFFRGGSFFWKDQISGTNWQGEGDLSTEIGLISGQIGECFVSSHLQGSFDAFSAFVKSEGAFNGELMIQTKWEGPEFHFHVNQGNGTLFSFLRIEDFQMQGEVGKRGFSCFDIRGSLGLEENKGKKVSFHSPIFQQEGPFDFRFEHPLFDLARIVGSSQGKTFSIDARRSHIFGQKIQQIEGVFSEEGLNQFRMHCVMPWKFFSFFFDIPPFFTSIGKEDCLTCQCSYEKEKGMRLELLSQFSFLEKPFDLHMHIVHREGVWHLEPSRILDGLVEGSFQWGKEGIHITQGKGTWKEGVEVAFSGRIASLDQWDLKLSSLRADLHSLPLFDDWKIEGILEGKGILHWEGGLESDFDLIASGLTICDHPLENEGSLHVYYSSKKGVYVRGLNLSMTDPDALVSLAKWKSGLFQYDLTQDLFSFMQLQFYLPADFSFSPSLDSKIGLLSQAIGYKKGGASFPLKISNGLQGIADLAFSSDFSNVSLSMKEAEISLEDSKYHIQNLHFDMDKKDCKMNFNLDHQSRFIPIDLAFRLDPFPSGQLTIENGLKVDWSYRDRLILQTIEGRCSGIDASFHLEGDSLIGSARLNCNELKELLPQKIARVFHELKIGNGYELMGRVFLSDQGLGFRGILRGKQIELFNFELKNILARIEWDANHLLISDLKVSDFAGVLKVDQILAQGVGEAPWTLSIPHISITELRPSLLQDVGGPPGKLSPLVVRELRLENFQGLVEDGKTYTAQGELYFINSYKREKSILEIPSDLLSRIVGLDLDLLIPVCGTLRYELHDGFFHFTELEGSFSENKRSEFFLVFNKDSPKMDLDWNLSILIQMKQFVLFKFTEAFIISVKGKLDEPKFQLQRKKRFLGVL